MRYQKEIEINLPRERVIELFDSFDNLYKWMEGFKQHKHLSGTEGEVGAITEMHFDMGKRQMVMQEEIIETNFPKSITTMYRMDGLENLIVTTFVDKGPTTIWGMDVQFEFSGFGMKLMSKLMPGMFKKQTMKNMQAFKAFAESQ